MTGNDPIENHEGVGDEIYRARLEASDCPSEMTAGETRWIDISLQNESAVAWPSPDIGIPDVAVTYHWLQSSGEPYHYLGQQTRLPSGLAPGETTQLSVRVEAPREPGHYLLQWDLLIEQVAWFTERGWRGPVSEVEVVQGVTIDVPVSDSINVVDTGTQLLLRFKYQELARQGSPLPHFSEVEFRNFSQSGEDGILLYLFSLIGEETRRAVEICAGDGIECNSANLILNHGWTGLLVDGDPERIRRARAFYTRSKDTWMWPPTIAEAWVTVDNVNDLIRKHGFEGEIDLLSLDMDGVDYWIWKAIDCINPRVVVLEYQSLWGPDRSVTVPYDPNFRPYLVEGFPDYAGASLAAFIKLGRSKGYRLVGCQRLGFNAFFVRQGVGEDIFPEIDAASCFSHPVVRHGMETRLGRVLHLPWEEV